MSTALATLAGKLAERVGMDSVDPQELITTLRQTAFKGDASDAQFIALLIPIVDDTHDYTPPRGAIFYCPFFASAISLEVVPYSPRQYA